MAQFLDKVVQAVVERSHHMERQRRRSPRPYTKRLKSSSRGIPALALPSSPMPDEPWYDSYEDEAEVPFIG